jgi:hypothetical protein
LETPHGGRVGVNGSNMKKAPEQKEDSTMRAKFEM